MVRQHHPALTTNDHGRIEDGCKIQSMFCRWLQRQFEHIREGARGYCSAHYQRLRRHGSPTAGGTAHHEPLRWMMEVAKPCQSCECLYWPFSRSAEGYAVIRLGKETRSVSRMICEELNGLRRYPDFHAAHSCGEGRNGCVNGSHVRWATVPENCADKLIHGRTNRGERNAKNKISEDDVRSIRRMHGSVSISEMSRQYGITRTSVRYIIERRNWAWLD